MAACEAIPDEARLWRRVHPISQISRPDEPAEVDVRGDAFRARKDEDGASVEIASVYEDQGLGPAVLLLGFDDTWGVAEVTMRQCRDLECHVVQTSDDPSDGHAEIVPRPQKATSRSLSKGSSWVLRPRWPR